MRLLAVGLLWPSVFCSVGRSEEDSIRVSKPLLIHFPRPACEFFCLSSGLQLSRHFECGTNPTTTPHTDQCTGCICIKRMQRKLNNKHKSINTTTHIQHPNTNNNNNSSSSNSSNSSSSSSNGDQQRGGPPQHEWGPHHKGVPPESSQQALFIEDTTKEGVQREYQGGPQGDEIQQEGPQGEGPLGGPHTGGPQGGPQSGGIFGGPQREGPQGGPPSGGPLGDPQGGPQQRSMKRTRDSEENLIEEEWLEFWAVSKRRFYNIWRQRASQLVPETPAASLIEAVRP